MGSPVINRLIGPVIANPALVGQAAPRKEPVMFNHSRNQGARTEHTLTARLTEAGVPATKISRSGYQALDCGGQGAAGSGSVAHAVGSQVQRLVG